MRASMTMIGASEDAGMMARPKSHATTTHHNGGADGWLTKMFSRCGAAPNPDRSFPASLPSPITNLLTVLAHKLTENKERPDNSHNFGTNLVTSVRDKAARCR